MPDLIALHWDQTQVAALEAESGRGGLKVRHGFVAAWPEDLDWKTQPQKAGQWLRQQLDQQGFSSRETLVALSREEAVVRPLDLPDVPDDELPAMVRFQGAMKSTVPLDQLRLDYLPLPRRADGSGRTVLMTTVPGRLAERVREFVSAAGLELTSLTLSPLAVAELVARAERQQSSAHEASLVLFRRGSQLELTVLHHQHVLATHAQRIIADTPEQDRQAVVAEIARFQVPVQPLLGGERLKRIWLVGDEQPADVQRALHERFGVEVTTLDPQEIRAVHHTVPEPPNAFAVPLGALLSNSGPVVPAIDFLNPRKPAVKRDLRRVKIGLAAAGLLVIVGVAAVSARLEISDLEAQIEQLRTDDKELEKQNTRNEPILQSAQLISAWEAQGPSVLDQLQRVNQALPGTERLYLRQFQIEPATGDAVVKIRGKAYGRERRDVQNFQQALVEANYRVRPQEIQVTRKDPEYRHEFDLDAELLPEPKAAPPTAAGGQKHAAPARGLKIK